MTLFKTATLLPQVRLNPKTAEVLHGLCDTVKMLSLDDAAVALPDFVQTFRPEAPMVADINAAYGGLKKLGDMALAENVALKDYAGAQSEAAPLYDKEAPTGIMADFRAGGAKAGGTGDTEASPIVAAGVTLLLCEDMEALSREAAAGIVDADEQTRHMWDELKGGKEYLNTQTASMVLNLQHDLYNESMVKKRLTAWSILARIPSIESEIYLTLDKASFDYCLQIFKPQKPFQEVNENNAKAEFYKLETDARGFFNALAGQKTDVTPVETGGVVLGYLDLTAA